MEFDLLQETWNRTSFADLQPGSRVNLERALAVGARLGGHFVTGHIDGTGRIRRWEPSGKDHVLELEVPKAMRRYLLPKGSIAIEGLSLTIADVLPTGLRAWIIPHTREVTALVERKAGDRVNLEADLLGKYVDQLLRAGTPPRAARR
jgi:riboflavin synthase